MTPRRVLFLAPLLVLLFPSTAFAHHALASGTTTCSDSAHQVTWSLVNEHPKQRMLVKSAVSLLNGRTYSTVFESPVGPKNTATATTEIPGNLTGTVELTVAVAWPDDYHRILHASVLLKSACPPPVTNPPTTTTSTTTPPSSTVPPTTTPSECGGPNELPCTGGASHSQTLALLGGVGVVYGTGLLLVARRRRTW